jgi:hypothetical protein
LLNESASVPNGAIGDPQYRLKISKISSS